MTLDELFALHDSTVPGERGCRRWPFGLNKGYPQAHIDGKMVRAHRLGITYE